MWWHRIFRGPDRAAPGARVSSHRPGAQAASLQLDDAFVRRLDRLALRLSRRLPGHPGGERVSRRHVPSVDVSDHRAYTPGDDLRHIDWHTYARHDQLIVRLGDTSQAVPVTVVLDCSRSMAWGPRGHGMPDKWSAACRIAAALGYIALASGDRLSFAVFSDVWQPLLGPVQGKAFSAELFARVRALQPVERTALAPALDAARRRGSARNGLYVIVSDFLTDDDPADTLAAFGAPQRETLALHLLHPLELEPAVRGSVDLEDVETGERLAFDLNEQALSAYRVGVTAWRERIARAVQRHGGTYAQVVSEWALERQVIPYLRRRGALSA